MTQFNPAAPLDSEAHGYCKSPGLKEQIHCVVYVIDCCTISVMPSKLEAKLDAIRRKVNLMGQYKLESKIENVAWPLVGSFIYGD